MKIYKLKDTKKRLYREALFNFLDSGDSSTLKKLERAVDFGKDLTEDEFNVLYYAISYYVSNLPRVTVAPVDAVINGAVDRATIKLREYQELQQDLYLTKVLSKPDGLEYAKGSLKFTEEQYQQRQSEIMNEIKAGAEIAGKVLGIEINPVDKL